MVEQKYCLIPNKPKFRYELEKHKLKTLRKHSNHTTHHKLCMVRSTESLCFYALLILQIRSWPSTESPSLTWRLDTFPLCGAEITIS